MPRLRCYDPSGTGSGGIYTWLGTLRPEVLAAVDAAVEIVGAARHLTDLSDRLYKPLRGRCTGLGEIIVEFDTGRKTAKGRSNFEHYRILTYEGPNRDELTLLHGFQKAGGPDYGPACRTAYTASEG